MQGIRIWKQPSPDGRFYYGALYLEDLTHHSVKAVGTLVSKEQTGWMLERWLYRKALVRWYNRYCHRPDPYRDKHVIQEMDELPYFLNNATTLHNVQFYRQLEDVAVRMQWVMRNLQIINRRDYHLLVFLEHEAQEQLKWLNQ